MMTPAVNLNHHAGIRIVEIHPGHEAMLIADDALTQGNRQSVTAKQLKELGLECTFCWRGERVPALKDETQHARSAPTRT